MTCKLHIPFIYDYALAEFRCLCGAMRIAEDEYRWWNGDMTKCRLKQDDKEDHDAADHEDSAQ